METEYTQPKDSAVITQDENAAASPFFASRSASGRSAPSFSERMAEAGYITGRRYDAVKNAFLSYRSSDRKPKGVRTRLTHSGETFAAGRRVLGKLCLVGGYLRLFLALDPAAYAVEKYHHKDYTEVLRYARFPFMIKLSSDRQVRYAEELIGEVLRAAGYEPDPTYVPHDQANIFRRTWRRPVSRAGEAVAGAAMALPGETASPAPSGESPSAGVDTDEKDVGEPEQIDVRIPENGVVLNKLGERIGRIRRRVVYDDEGQETGVLRKEQTNVFLYENGERTAYLDRNDNLISLQDKYRATVRRRASVLILALLPLFFLTLISSVVGLYFLMWTGPSGYAPLLFVAGETGNEWHLEEELPVFYNETFGDNVVAPGMQGSYRFTFENRNADPLAYTLHFAEENPAGIGIVYRLKRDGAYLGETGEYVPLGELDMTDLTIEAESSSVFEIEWLWSHSDAVDTSAGLSQAQYRMRISLTAWVDSRV